MISVESRRRERDLGPDPSIANILSRVESEADLTLDEGECLMNVAGNGQLTALLAAAADLRDRVHGRMVSFSKKVFLPLTNLCRDDCGYCTFKRDPGQPGAHTMEPDEVIERAELAAALGCKEALFSLGDRPEARFPTYREQLRRYGFNTTLAYLRSMCERVLLETGLLPHANPGVMSRSELERLAPYNASMGLMLESTSARLLAPGGAHHGAPDKRPSLRLKTIEEAGKLGIPFTTGILIGIGETPRERVEALIAIRELQRRYGHIQEVIIQNFRAKPGIPMAAWPEPSLHDLARTIAVARLILGAEVNLQAPPNLSPATYPFLLRAGINDWGGISPLTVDYINPEAPWPQLEMLADHCATAGFELRERLAIYPQYARDPRWQREPVARRIAALRDAAGYARN